MNALAVLLLGIVAVNALTPEEKLFINHVQRYNKKYEGADSFFKRFHIFKDNLAYIQAENTKNHSYTLGLNEFADMTKQEFFSTHTGLMQRPQGVKKAPVFSAPANFAPTADVDWRKNGAVTPVKNQGQCGSCWAFSTTGALEGAFQIKEKTLPNLSEQQLVDCAGDSGNMGCNGGLMDYAFTWLQDNGACTQTEYPYKGYDQDCQKQCQSHYKTKGYTDVQSGSEAALTAAVTKAPTSVAIEADQSAFQFYSGGIFTAACGQQLDHGVTAVGFVTSGSQPYWIVKNSWGTSWGEQGYIRMVRGKNQCGINNMASFPTI
jgi:C1A family cysteine protease